MKYRNCLGKKVINKRNQKLRIIENCRKLSKDVYY